MANPVCCVDQERPGTKSIGGRWFCDEHYQKATYSRAGFWRTGLIAIVALLVFVAAVVALDYFLKPNLGGAGLLVVGVVLAIVPAALWLVFFYQQDRLEPEPVGNVARMFVIALALAGAIGIPLTEQFFRVQEWIYRDAGGVLSLTNILGSIFITGAIEAFLIFATVRYFIFDSPEFDERTDGVIYGTAAGLGYATALNLQFILANGGAALGSGEVFVAEVALAHAAFGGLLGYFLGRAKLEQEPVWWLPTGLVVATALNGAFLILRGQLDQGAVTIGQTAALPTFWNLLAAGILAVVVTGLVTWLISRDIARSLSDKQPPPTADPTIGDRQSNYFTIGVFVLLMLVGVITWSNATNRTTAFDTGVFKGAYPYYFSDDTTDGEILHVVDSFGTGAEFLITSFDLPSGQATAAAKLLAGDRSSTFALYKVIDDDFARLHQETVFTQQFTYVDANGLTGAVPTIRQGMDYIIVKDGKAIVVTLLTTPDDLAEVEPLFSRFLNSLVY